MNSNLQVFRNRYTSLSWRERMISLERRGFFFCCSEWKERKVCTTDRALSRRDVLVGLEPVDNSVTKRDQ